MLLIFKERKRDRQTKTGQAASQSYRWSDPDQDKQEPTIPNAFTENKNKTKMTKNCNSKSSFQDYQEGTTHCHSHGWHLPFSLRLSHTVLNLQVCTQIPQGNASKVQTRRKEKKKRLNPLHPPKTALYITLHFKPECPIPFPNSPLQQFRVRLVYP